MDESSVVSRIAHQSCSRAPSFLATGHWWEELDRDFARRPEGFELAVFDRLRVGAAAGFDTVLRTAGAAMISSMALPVGYNPIELRKAIRDSEFYADIAKSADPARFFATPPSGVRVRAKKGRWLPRFEPEDGTCEALSFDSPFEPVNPNQHKPYLRHSANRIAHARMLFTVLGARLLRRRPVAPQRSRRAVGFRLQDSVRLAAT